MFFDERLCGTEDRDIPYYIDAGYMVVYPPAEPREPLPATAHQIVPQRLLYSGRKNSRFWHIISGIWTFVTNNTSTFLANVRNHWREGVLQQLEKLLVTVTLETIDLNEQAHRGRISEADYRKLRSSAQGHHGIYGARDVEEDYYGERVKRIDMLWKEIRDLEILLLEGGSM